MNIMQYKLRTYLDIKNKTFDNLIFKAFVNVDNHSEYSKFKCEI